jgi:hypothetical protein
VPTCGYHRIPHDLKSDWVLKDCFHIPTQKRERLRRKGAECAVLSLWEQRENATGNFRCAKSQFAQNSPCALSCLLWSVVLHEKTFYGGLFLSEFFLPENDLFSMI